MSRALGAAFLHHQVEQLEKSVSSNPPTSGNWRDRRPPINGSSGAGRRGPNSPSAKGPPRKKAGGDGSSGMVTGERLPARDKDFDRSTNFSPTRKRGSREEERKAKDADIVVVDASVLINALYQVKKWCRDGREEVIIVPLEGEFHQMNSLNQKFIFCTTALNTLDLLKKGTSSLAQKARAASRILEAQVGTNPRIRVQRDDAFVLWDQIKFDESASANPNVCPEWVRRIICCVQWENEHPDEELKSTGKPTVTAGKVPKVALAVLSSLPPSSPQWGSVSLSTESPVPLPAPTVVHTNRHEPRSTGILVSTWASKAGITLLDIEASLPDRGGGGGGGEEDERSKRTRGRRPSAGEHVTKPSLVERPPAVQAMMEMVSQPTKVIRVLARGEKLDP